MEDIKTDIKTDLDAIKADLKALRDDTARARRIDFRCAVAQAISWVLFVASFLYLCK